MKSIVLFIVLVKLVFSLAQVGKNENTRRFHYIPRPQQNVQLCHLRNIPPNPWPKIGMNQLILPASHQSNTAWRTNQIGKNQNQRYPEYRYHSIPLPQQKVQGCPIPPNPWQGLRTNQLILPSSTSSNTAWRTYQIGKSQNQRYPEYRYHWIPPPQQKVHGCLIPPNPWPKLGTNQWISPASSPSNVGWRSNQGMYNWMNPFYFGLSNYYPQWGYQHHYPSSEFSRYTSRLPLASNLGMPLPSLSQPTIHARHWSIQPHFGQAQHMQFFGPPHGLWQIMPQIGPTYPPFYIADRV